MTSEHPASPAKRQPGIVRAVRWGSWLLILASVFLMVRSLPIEQGMSHLKTWIADLGIWGPVALVLVYIAATILFVPGVILTLMAGAVFSLFVGFLTVSIGATIGAGLAFLIARYVAREKIAELSKENTHFQAIDAAVAEGGWKIVALLRLSPAIPFNLQNYLYGLTQLKFWPYLLTSWIAMMPGTFLYVYLGHATGAVLGAERSRSVWEWVFLGVGLLATVIVTIYVTRLAKQKLNSEVEDASDTENLSELKEDSEESPPTLRSTLPLGITAVVLLSVSLAMFFFKQSIEDWLFN